MTLRPRRLSQADRQQVERLHAAGLSRNDIAREIGRSPSTVSGIARTLGLTFDRRATLAVTLLGDAERLRAKLCGTMQ